MLAIDFSSHFFLQLKKCPLCNASVQKLPRHMRTVHRMSHEDAVGITNKTNQRKPYSTKNIKVNHSKVRRDYKMRVCPVEGCNRYVKRLSDHIRYMHKNYQKKKIRMPTATNEFETIPEEPIETETSIPPVFKRRDQRCKFKNTSNDTYSKLIVVPEGCYSYEQVLEDFQAVSKEVLSEYEKYSMSCDAGFRHERNAKQMSGHINSFMHLLCEDSFKNLFSIEKLRDIFTEKTQTGQWRASSASTYRNTLKDFLIFLELSKKIVVPPNVVQDLRGALKRWAKGNHQLFKVQRYERIKSTEKLILQPEEIAEFYNTEFCRESIKTFGLAAAQEELSRSQFCMLRNYLLLRVYLKQGLRTGVCAMLTIKEYLAREHDPVTNLTSIEVTEHKTTAAYGDAIIFLADDLANYFEIYYTQVRPIGVANSPSDYFFTSWSGKAMNSSDINNACKSSLKSIGLHHVYVTLIRKSLVTTVHEFGDEEDMKTLSIGMDHDVETAKKHYAHRNKLSSAQLAYKSIERISQAAIKNKGN